MVNTGVESQVAMSGQSGSLHSSGRPMSEPGEAASFTERLAGVTSTGASSTSVTMIVTTKVVAEATSPLGVAATVMSKRGSVSWLRLALPPLSTYTWPEQPAILKTAWPLRMWPVPCRLNRMATSLALLLTTSLSGVPTGVSTRLFSGTSKGSSPGGTAGLTGAQRSSSPDQAPTDPDVVPALHVRCCVPLAAWYPTAQPCTHCIVEEPYWHARPAWQSVDTTRSSNQPAPSE
mmetsp:Transcript_18136/g.68577  ORF Transcript_18136/g.68577 Transcript_18136/m.68577 type:complete len:233 (+) Transcript_18136:9587-10285(+)